MTVMKNDRTKCATSTQTIILMLIHCDSTMFVLQGVI